MISEEALKKARETVKQRMAAGMSAYMTPIERSISDPKSLRKAINAKCYDCTYDPASLGRWLDQVRQCMVTDCPLYQLRPGK